MQHSAEPLLERESELATLEAALKDVRAGAGRVVFVRGPAGIGKSRLLAAVGESAALAGTFLVRARGGELERDFAFGVARQLFERPLAALPEAERAAALQGAAGIAAPVIGLAEDRAGPVRGDQLFPVLHGLYWLCANLAAQRPLVIELDDAHWGDEQSLLWLAYLVRRIVDIPALVVLAARDATTPAAAPLTAIATDPLTAMVEPQPLSVPAVRSLVAGVVGVAPAPPVVAALHERSTGNPFVVRELAASLAASGIRADSPQAADRVADVLPGTVARSVLARLAQLPQPAVALACAIAVLAGDAQLPDAARLAGLGDDVATDALDTLVVAGFVRSGTPLTFSHPLMREVIYEDLSPGRRRAQHRRAADVLAARIAPERIGAHLLQCDPQQDSDSVEVLRRCAARALRRGAPATAVRYLERALEEGPGVAVRGPLLRELGSAEVRLGRPDAIEHLEEALRLAESTIDIGAATRDLALGLAALGRWPESVAACDRGIAALDGRDRELALLLEGELCALGQMAVSTTAMVADRLRRIAPNLAGETPGERLVLASFAHLRSNELAPTDEIADLAIRALADGALLREQTADAAGFYQLMWALFRADRSDLSDRWLDEAVEEARRRGSLLGTSVALAVRSQMHYVRGDLAAAESDAQISIDSQIAAGWNSVLPLAVAVRADCLLEAGEVERAMQLFDDARLAGPLPELQMYRWTQAARGRARIAGGRADDGIADLLDCERAPLGARPSVALLWRCDAALALAGRGDTEQAYALASAQVELARKAQVDRPLGVSLRTLGLLSHDEEARSLLTEAVALLESSSARLEHARALVELGAHIRRAGQRGAAREHLEAGYELARACGSKTLVERARDELTAAGVRMRRAAFTGRDALTPSERRVAEMAATGMSNPEIAQALFVTRKTIEMHLGHVYSKLAVAGRDELAAALQPDPAAAKSAAAA